LYLTLAGAAATKDMKSTAAAVSAVVSVESAIKMPAGVDRV
jgi:hypothetical protein